jgi:nucleoid-associated protein YgaU
MLNKAGVASALLGIGSGDGSLQKLTIAYTGHEEIEPKSPIVALFNPHEISRSRSVDWYQKTVASQGGGWTWLDTQQQFLAVAAETLSIELFFDTYESREQLSGRQLAASFITPTNPFQTSDASDVTALTQRVARLAEVDQNLHHPPVCTLSWGGFGTFFTGVLTSLDQRYTLFTADGTPVRATLSCSFLEFQTSAHARAREMNSADVVKTHVVRRGDTLHSIAAQEYRDPARWRHIATANGIVNPREVAPGTVLTIPRLG